MVKKVIVAKEKLCSSAHSDHEKDSLFSSCGHYTTGGGIMQEGIEKLKDFFKLQKNNCQILSEAFRSGKQMKKQIV